MRMRLRGLTAPPSGSLTARGEPIGTPGGAARCYAASRDRLSSWQATMRRSPRSRAAEGRVARAAIPLSGERRLSLGISPRTRRDYIKQIKRIEHAFGDFPIKALDDRDRRAVFLDWRDKLAQRRCGKPTMPMAPWRAILSWAHNRGLIAENPCANGGKLYHGSRASKIWHDEEVSRFLRTAPLYLRLAMLLAMNTGQRQGDPLRLPWSAYDGATIRCGRRKTGAWS